MRRAAITILSTALVLGACTSKPRTFEPVLAAAPQSDAAYQERLLYCRQQLAAAMDKSGRLASAAGGAAAGAGAGLAAGASAASAASGTMMAGAAAAAAMVMVAPVAVLGGAWGVAKIKRTKKEKAIKAALAHCLAEGGFQVAKWDKLTNREAKALAAELEESKPAAPKP